MKPMLSFNLAVIKMQVFSLCSIALICYVAHDIAIALRTITLVRSFTVGIGQEIYCTKSWC